MGGLTGMKGEPRDGWVVGIRSRRRGGGGTITSIIILCIPSLRDLGRIPSTFVRSTAPDVPIQPRVLKVQMFPKGRVLYDTAAWWLNPGQKDSFLAATIPPDQSTISDDERAWSLFARLRAFPRRPFPQLPHYTTAISPLAKTSLAVRALQSDGLCAGHRQHMRSDMRHRHSHCGQAPVMFLVGIHSVRRDAQNLEMWVPVKRVPGSTWSPP